MKLCTKCAEYKDLSLFNKHATSRDGFRGSCKACDSIAQRSRYVLNKQHVLEVCRRYTLANHDQVKAWKRNNLLKHNYGITSIEFEEMAERQNGVCYLCGRICSVRKHLSVDHDHVTGAVRKLLCHFCNTALGLFRDDIELVKKAATYLEEHNESHSG